MGDPSAPDTMPADIITSAGIESLETARARRERFVELTNADRDLNERKRRIKAQLDELEPLVLEDFIEDGTDSMRVGSGDGRKSVYLKPELWAGPKKTGIDEESGEPKATDDDWKRAVDAARKAGVGHLVQERFNGQSFSGWLRKFRDEHGPGWRDALPAAFFDAIEVKDDTRVRMRKA